MESTAVLRKTVPSPNERNNTPQIDDYEPLVKLLPKGIRNSPLRVALAFALSSFLSSCAAAAFEGRLFTAEPGVLPLWGNFSTLLDFLLIDPLVIFYVLRSYQAMADMSASALVETRERAPVFTGLAALLSLLLMTAYAWKFLDGTFLDACVIGKGIENVTITGWLLFGWTAIFLYIVFGAVFAQIVYVGQVLQFCRGGARSYQPLHADGSGGLRVLAQPAMEFLRVMAGLLLLFLGFYIYDHVVYEIPVSNRLNNLLIYLLVTPPLFLTPVLSLRSSMLQHRDSLLQVVSNKLQATLADLGNLSASKGAEEIEALAKLQKQIREFPTWPLPVRQMIESTSYILGPAVAYVPSVVGMLLPGK